MDFIQERRYSRHKYCCILGNIRRTWLRWWRPCSAHNRRRAPIRGDSLSLADIGSMWTECGDSLNKFYIDCHTDKVIIDVVLPFQMMIWSLTAIGTMFSIAFLVGIADPSRAGYGKTVTKLETGFTLSCSGRATSIEQHSKQLKWYQWFAERKFYVVSVTMYWWLCWWWWLTGIQLAITSLYIKPLFSIVVCIECSMEGR